MQITQETTIEAMREAFNFVTMQVVDGEYKVQILDDKILEEGKETIHLKGVKGSWIKEAQFDSKTRRAVLNTEWYPIRPTDVWPYFMPNCDYPEQLRVGDMIVCLCSKYCSDPWIVTAWVPEWVYIQHLERMKRKFAV